MIALIRFVLTVLTSPFKSKSRLEAKNVVLRHQLIVSRRKLKGRARLTNDDRWFFVQMYRCFPSILTVVTIVRPETLVRWHRAGFRRYWRWKSNSRIHGELLKLGFNVAQSTVAKYTVKRPGPPSQGGKTVLRKKDAVHLCCAGDISWRRADIQYINTPLHGIHEQVLRPNRRANRCPFLGEERTTSARAECFSV